jgi:tetratricopeptide (TPR) repeat protein
VILGNEQINQGKLAPGEDQYREAAKLLEALIAAAPKEPTYRQQLESTYRNLTIILSATNRPDEAAEYASKADSLLEKAPSPDSKP